MLTRQEEQAVSILECAQHALNVSQEAYRVAQEAFQKPEDIAEQVRQLEREYDISLNYKTV